MTTFFRRIRKTMADDNRPMQYARYAIGEIALVVIGILIALQINNWNVQRQKEKLEKVLLEQVKMDLLTVDSDVENDMTILELGMKSHHSILASFNINQKYADSMCFDFYWLTQDEYIYPKEAVYGRIKEEGLDIIKNDSIRFGLKAIYESIYPRLTKTNAFYPDIEDLFSDYYLDHFSPNTDLSLIFTSIHENNTISYPIVFNRNGIERKRTIGYIPLDFEALKRDNKFHMLMDKARKYRGYKLYRYEMAQKATAIVVRLINTELGIEQDHEQ